MALVLFWMIVPENSLCSRTELHRSTATVFFEDDTSRTTLSIADTWQGLPLVMYPLPRCNRRYSTRYVGIPVIAVPIPDIIAVI